MTHGVFAWLVEHAADVINKCRVGRDGKTAFERLKGKPHTGEFLEFGCRIMHRVSETPQGGLMTPRWIDGVWLGKRFTTNEHIVASTDGRVFRARDVRAKPPADSWNFDALSAIVGSPWDSTGALPPRESS